MPARILPADHVRSANIPACNCRGSGPRSLLLVFAGAALRLWQYLAQPVPVGRRDRRRRERDPHSARLPARPAARARPGRAARVPRARQGLRRALRSERARPAPRPACSAASPRSGCSRCSRAASFRAGPPSSRPPSLPSARPAIAYSAEVKQYSTDAAATIALTLLAFHLADRAPSPPAAARRGPRRRGGSLVLAAGRPDARGARRRTDVARAAARRLARPAPAPARAASPGRRAPRPRRPSDIAR